MKTGRGYDIKGFTKWLTKSLQGAIDPERSERIGRLAAQLEHQLQVERKKFSLDQFIERVDHTPRDLEAAKRIVVKKLIDRAWSDDTITSAERSTLDWITERLELSPSQVNSFIDEQARDRFALAMAHAMDDGHVDEGEAKRLQSIAASLGFSVGQFIRKFFPIEGENFLRSVFTACTEEGMLPDDAWAQLVTTTQRLGLSQAELNDAIRPQAERFVEHVLADAKSDGSLSEADENLFTSLIDRLDLAPQSRNYVRQQINAFGIIRRAKSGKLPVVAAPPGISIRSGEIVHFHTPAKWLQLKLLKSGDIWEEHLGHLSITDNRLLFSSSTRSFDVRFAKIVAVGGKTGEINLQRAEKPQSAIVIDESEPVAIAILDCAIALSNQTRLARQSADRTRHIPREVRQRIWQRYAGRCAECEASDYLEFDHIVPVSKGGSNSEANVQLLCRRCNSKKSDLI